MEERKCIWRGGEDARKCERVRVSVVGLYNDPFFYVCLDWAETSSNPISSSFSTKTYISHFHTSPKIKFFNLNYKPSSILKI